MEEWRATRDPVKLAAARLLADKVLRREDLERIQADADKEADEMEAWADQSPKATPPIAELLAGVYAP